MLPLTPDATRRVSAPPPRVVTRYSLPLTMLQPHAVVCAVVCRHVCTRACHERFIAVRLPYPRHGFDAHSMRAPCAAIAQYARCRYAQHAADSERERRHILMRAFTVFSRFADFHFLHYRHELNISFHVGFRSRRHASVSLAAARFHARFSQTSRQPAATTAMPALHYATRC